MISERCLLRNWDVLQKRPGRGASQRCWDEWIDIARLQPTASLAIKDFWFLGSTKVLWIEGGCNGDFDQPHDPSTTCAWRREKIPKLLGVSQRCFFLHDLNESVGKLQILRCFSHVLWLDKSSYIVLVNSQGLSVTGYKWTLTSPQNGFYKWVTGVITPINGIVILM